MSNLGPQFDGIRVEGVSERQFPGVTLHRGRVAENQFGYRGVSSLDELEPVEHHGPPNGLGPVEGYRSRGKHNVGPEKHSRGVTMFAAQPLSAEQMETQGYTHQAKVDISGMAFRSLKAPEGDLHHADMGLGLGVVGQMNHSRIHEVRDREGKALDPEYFDTYGDRIKHNWFEDTGRWPGGR